MELNRKRAKVVMLPTERIFDKYLNKTLVLIDGKLKLCQNGAEMREGMPQHLYFITDNDIKKGDWVLVNYEFSNKSIAQVKSVTNKGLFLNISYDIMANRCKKIVATTNKSLGLPQPSEAFVQKYVELGGIDEVDIEVESKIIITQTEPILQHQGEIPKVVPHKVTKQIKVDSHNTITIHPIKNSWNREELEFLKGSSGNHLKFIYERLAFVHKENVNYDYMLKLKEIVDWVDKNLK